MALTADRNTKERDGNLFSVPVYRTSKIYAGAIVMMNATGYAVPGAAAAGQVCLGRAEARADNSAGNDGDIDVAVKRGVFLYADTEGFITGANLGSTCYIVDDETVSINSDEGGRSAAGTVVGVDSDGVWVRMGI